MKLKFAVATLAALPSVAFANKVTPEEEKFPLTGSVELGFLYKTGNTHSADMKTGLDLRFEQDQWLSLLSADLLVKKSDIEDADSGESHFETTDQKWTITSQTNYTLTENEKNYVYGAVWYEDNNFNSFRNQSSISAGWGRHWYKTDNASLWADVGPGYKRDVLKPIFDGEGNLIQGEKTEGTLIAQAQALYIRTLNEHVEFKQYFSAKYAIQSGENSIYKAESTITTKLIKTLQLKFTFTIDYNTEVEQGKENLDTQTAATLVYSF